MTENTHLGPFETAVKLVEVGKRDPLYRDLYRERAARYLTQVLPPSEYDVLRKTDEWIETAMHDSRIAIAREDWTKVKELAGRISRLKRNAAGRQHELEVARNVYESDEIGLDPFSPGLSLLLSPSERELRRKRDQVVSDLLLLEEGDPEWRQLYAARRVHFAALPVSLEATEESGATIDSSRLAKDAFGALELGDADRLYRLADEILARGNGSGSQAGSAAGPQAATSRGTLGQPLPQEAVERGRELGLVALERPADLAQAEAVARAAWRPQFLAEEVTQDGGRRFSNLLQSLAGREISAAARDLLLFFVKHPFVNSAGVRYLPPFEKEVALIEDFSEKGPIPESSPLLAALELPRRRALSRVAIERALRAHGTAVLEQHLGLDPREYRIVCIPPDLYTSIGRECCWGEQPFWTHLDGYQLLEQGGLRALVGGDVRFGGLHDLVSISRDDEREGVIARLAVVRRERLAAIAH
jgi:hypothetical protein